MSRNAFARPDRDAASVLSTREAAETTGYCVGKLRALTCKATIQASKVEGRWATACCSLYLCFAEHS